MCVGPTQTDTAGSVQDSAPAVKALYNADTRSYAEMFEELKGTSDVTVIRNAMSKPSMKALAKCPTAKTYPASGATVCTLQRPLLNPQLKTLTAEEAEKVQQSTFFWRKVGFLLIHGQALSSMWFTFSPAKLALAIFMWWLQISLGINMGFHRLLAHRAFKTSKPVEYFLSFCALLSLQGPPLEWVSNHRYHHLHTDTPLDLHSPYEGFFHAHMGWLFDAADTERPFLDRANVADMAVQPYYQFLEKTWVPIALARWLLTWFVLGYDVFVWSMAVPIMLGWHSTFLVNSASHLWGRQPYDAGDLSRNNWFVGIFDFGEGWHNSHHAFPFSARHGLEWYEIDVTYYGIKALELFGLAWDVQLPTEKQKERRRKSDQEQKMW